MGKNMTARDLAICAAVVFMILANGCGLNVSGQFDAGDEDTTPDGTDSDGSEFIDGPDSQDIQPEYECLVGVDCTDGDPCNGEETCDPGAHTCIAGTPLDEGTVCGSEAERMICLTQACVLSRCGDGFIDRGAGESCEPPGLGGCSPDCQSLCDGDEDCSDDGNICNGEERCNLGPGICESRNPLPDGAECAVSPRRICILATCQSSRCGDGYLDLTAGEECDDGNETPGDGCEPVTCLYSCHDGIECDDGHDCTVDGCNPETHTCASSISSTGTVCRSSAGPCDSQESCDGAVEDCPADLLLPSGASCSDADPCTYPDQCDEGGSCQGTASGLSDVIAVSSGDEHTCVLMATGGVKCWGRNDKGQLGIGTGTTESSAPVDVSGLSSGVSGICSGGKHSCALMISGAVKCWGFNSSGQLGNGATTDSSNPVDVSGLSGASAVACGGEHTCAVAGGGLKCWGKNDKGQIGDGTIIDKTAPVDVSGLGAVATGISCGGKHSCALLDTGSVQCWGDNPAGQLGNGTITDSSSPVDVSGLSSSCSEVSAGKSHTCALLGTGEVQCWGKNDRGQVGDSSNVDRLTAVDVVCR